MNRYRTSFILMLRAELAGIPFVAGRLPFSAVLMNKAAIFAVPFNV